MRTWKYTAATILALVVTLTSSEARGTSNSTVTFGIGTAVGVNSVTLLDTDARSTFTTELNLKLKAIQLFALELAYSPTDVVDARALVFESRFRLSALIYAVPTHPVNFYLMGGIGGGGFSELFSVEGRTNSYHAGGGLDWHIGDHMVVGAEFLLLLPGVTSVRQTIEAYANEELQRFQESEAEYEAPESTLEVADFISASNFRLALSARYYF